MVCPYSFDVPGGVQAHIIDLARVLIARGHEVSVLGPAAPTTALPDFVVSAGVARAIPYNGSVARLAFGPRSYRRVRAWLRDGDFDVLHIHEPNSPSVSLMALKLARGPIVATFHTSIERSLALAAFQGILRPLLERVRGRIAVSDLARRWQVQALGSDAVLIPNGVDVPPIRDAQPLPGVVRGGPTLLFLGRFDEPRKGMDVVLGALPALVTAHPGLRILVVGRGDEEGLRRRAGEHGGVFEFLGQVSDADKASAFHTADVYLAPNTGGESFGIVLVEAMAAGTPVVASALDAFRRVLDDGRAGVLFPVGDPTALADAVIGLLGDGGRRAALVAHASEVVMDYDWSVVADRVMRVYETVRHDGEKVTVEGRGAR